MFSFVALFCKNVDIIEKVYMLQRMHHDAASFQCNTEKNAVQIIETTA